MTRSTGNAAPRAAESAVAAAPAARTTAPLNWGYQLGQVGPTLKYWLSNPVPLSYSKINTYQTCAYKYRLIYKDKVPGRPSPYTAFGTVIHNTLYEYESLDPKVRTFDDLTALYRRNWRTEVDDYRRAWGASLYETIAAERQTTADELEKQTRDNGLLILKNYWREEQNNPNTVRFVEKWVSAELFHYRVAGRVDRLDQTPAGHYEIIDYKTGERIYDEESLKDASKGYGLQAGLYYEMCRESWRDRVDRFVFRYLQKKQDLLTHLGDRLVRELHDTVRGALAAGTAAPQGRASVGGATEGKEPTGAALPESGPLGDQLGRELLTTLRENLTRQLLVRIAAEAEGPKLRARIPKLGRAETEGLLANQVGPARATTRAYLKRLNREFESVIREELGNLTHDRQQLAYYEAESGVVIEKVLAGLDENLITQTVARYLANTAAAFAGWRTAGNWPALTLKELEKLNGEIIEFLYRMDLKEHTARELDRLTPGELAAETAADFAAVPEVPAAQTGAVLTWLLTRLRASYARALDSYSIGELATQLALIAPEEFLDAGYRRDTERLLAGLDAALGIGDPGRGRELNDYVRSQARQETLVRPLAGLFRRLLKTINLRLVAQLRAERSDELTAPQSRRLARMLRTLGEPLFVELITNKLVAAFARSLFHERHYQTALVPVVKAITDLFDRPTVAKVMHAELPFVTEERCQAIAASIVEKLDWRMVEWQTDKILGRAFAAWTDTIRALITPPLAAALKKLTAPDRVQADLAAAAAQFENRTWRIIARDVEVPYNAAMRENLHRVLDEVQYCIRTGNFETSKGALCGWCEYQFACPAWCRHRAECGDQCPGDFLCPEITDPATGTLVHRRPAGMSDEAYTAAVRAKYQVTDRSLFRLSFSKMNSYENCPMGYRKLYLDRNPPQPKSFFAIGISYHNAMEDLYAYAGPKAQPSLDLVKKIFRTKWVSAGYRSRAEEDFYFRRGLRMCEDYHARFIAGKYRTAFAREEYFEFPVGRTLLNGFIDRVDRNPDGSFVILDYKTNPKLYTPEELEDDQQMTMYYLAAREGKLDCARGQPFEPEKFVFQFVNFCQELETRRGPGDVEPFLERVAAATEEMEWRQRAYKESTFDPRVGMLLFTPQENKYCQSCDHQHVCPLTADFQLHERLEAQGLTELEDSDDIEITHDEEMAVESDAIATRKGTEAS